MNYCLPSQSSMFFYVTICSLVVNIFDLEMCLGNDISRISKLLGSFLTSTRTNRNPTAGCFWRQNASFMKNLQYNTSKIKGQRQPFIFSKDCTAASSQIRVLENTNKVRHGLRVIQDGHIKASSHSDSLIPLAGEIQELPGHFYSGESASITHNITNTQQTKQNLHSRSCLLH